MDNCDNMANSGNHTIILAVETSSRIGSAALARGDKLIEEATFSSPMQHSAEIFPAIEGLLTRHGHTSRNIGEIHIAIGPGSFTGLRIAVTLAKAMHLAQGVRIVTVGSLDVVAANLSESPRDAGSGPGEPLPSPLPGRIAALFDAKRGQFYVAIYDPAAPDAERCDSPAGEGEDYRIPAPGGMVWRKVHRDSLMTAREIIESFAGPGLLGVLGDGLLYHREEFAREGIAILPERYWSPHAANVYRLGRQKARAGQFADPLTLTPLYLRGPEVTLRKRSSPGAGPRRTP